MQLDIFTDSRDVMLRNDAAAALMRNDAASARRARQALEDEFPADPALQALAVLVDAAGGGGGPAALRDAAAARAARKTLQQHWSAAAHRALGPQQAPVWLAQRWEALARAAAQLPFRNEFAEDHAAAYWLEAACWRAACDAVAAIPSWRRIPAPLAWMAWGRCRLDGLDAAWPLLAELACLAPPRFESLLDRLGDPVLAQLRETFDVQIEGSGGVEDLAWFPAWVLIERPRLAARLGETQTTRYTEPERGLRLMLDLLALERQGRHHDLVARRKELRDLQPELYAAYMKSR